MLAFHRCPVPASPMQQTIPYLDPLVVRRLQHIDIKAKMIVEGFITGLHRSPYHGFSVEFAEHRAYNAGESLKNIDWKVYGKTDKLFSKKYEEETNLRCQVVLDVSDSMRYPVGEKDRLSKLEYGAYLAAALQYLMIGQRDAAGLTLFDEKVVYDAPPKSRYSWLLPMFVALEKLVQNQQFFTHKTAAASVLHQLAVKFHRRSLVVLITDLFNQTDQQDAFFKSLQHLRHANHEVIVFHLLDRKTEAAFDFPNRPHLLKDLETGETLEVHPQEVRAAYRERMEHHTETFRRKCYELKVDFIAVDVAQPYEKTLQDYIVKRQRLQ